MTLKNKDGDTLEVEESAYELDQAIVGIEISDFYEE